LREGVVLRTRRQRLFSGTVKTKRQLGFMSEVEGGKVSSLKSWYFETTEGELVWEDTEKREARGRLYRKGRLVSFKLEKVQTARSSPVRGIA